MMASPAFGLPAAIMPVRTSGILVWGALASSTGGGGGADPKRWPLVSKERSSGGWLARCAAPWPPGGALTPPPARWVRITAAWTPKAAGRTQTASCGGGATTSVRDAGKPAPPSHERVLIIELAP